MIDNDQEIAQELLHLRQRNEELEGNLKLMEGMQQKSEEMRTKNSSLVLQLRVCI